MTEVIAGKAALRIRMGAQQLATAGGRLAVVLDSISRLLQAELAVDHATAVAIDPATGLVSFGDATLRPGDDDVPLRSRGATWGAVALPAGAGARVALADAGSALADLLRLTMLRTALARAGSTPSPPALLIVHGSGRVEVVEPGAHWLDAVDDPEGFPSVIRAVATAARAGDGLARQSVAAADGGRVAVHGSLAAGVAGPDGVAVIVEGVREPVVAEPVADAIAGGAALADIDRDFYAPRRAAGAEPSPYGWYLT